MRFTLHLIKQRLLAIFGCTADLALFLGIVLIGGLGSSWYMVEAGSPLTTQRIGPWTAWTSAARSDADPYTRAHFARSGALQLSSEVARTYLAVSDSGGHRLQSSCEYAVEGRDLAAAWWSLGVFDERGRLLSNPLNRFAFTSDTITLETDGSFAVSLARDARAGNWLPTGGVGRLTLMLTLIDVRQSLQSTLNARRTDALPHIRKVACR